MLKLENECVACDLPCLGSSCSNREVPHYYCDECGEEETLYYFDDEELCEHCVINRLEKVEGSEW